jgi:hypothetical protein
MSYRTFFDRANELERAAGFARTLARYVAETEASTAGEAVARLQAANAHRPGESFSST